MMNTFLKVLLVTACCAHLAACGAAGTSSDSGVSVSDSAGIRLVEFRSLESIQVPERSMTLAAEIGADGGTALYEVSAARLLGSGGLAVGNGGTREVLYFDPDGELVRRAGRDGDGPGEFRAITTFAAAAGDSVMVYDVRLGRLTVLDDRGEVAGTRPLEPPSRAVDLLPLALDEDGGVLAVHGDARIFAPGGERRDTVPLMVIGPTAVDTVGLWPGRQWSFASAGQGSFRTEVGFGYALEASGRAGRAVVGSTDRLDLTVVDAGGETVMRIAATDPAQPVSDQAVQQWREGRLASLPDNLPEGIRRAVETTPHNERLPAFFDLLMDADRRIWIGEATLPEVVSRRWTVLGSDGWPAFRVVLPASATPLDAREDRLVVLDRTELDVEMIRVLRLSPTEDVTRD